MAFGDFTVDRDTAKYVLGSGGDIISYATDQPAFEFNADGSYKGLLVEPAATNLCLQSEDISTTWTASGDTTVTANNTTAPDGNSTADKLGDDNPGGSPTPTGNVYVEQTITVSGGTKYTASVFLKKDGLNWALLQAAGTGGVDNSPIQYFDLLNGVTGSGSAGIQAATIEAYPNDWYRCSITWTQGAGDTSFLFIIYVAEADNDFTLDLDGTSSIFVWGAQVETGPVATSYIPTTTASVTRNADDITLGSASSLIGQTEGTLYVEVDTRNATGIDQRLLYVTDNTNNNGFHITKLSANDYVTCYYRVGGSSIVQPNFPTNNPVTSGIVKYAVAYTATTFRLFSNGTAQTETTGLDASAMTTLFQIDLGQSYAANTQANMHIRAVALFTRRLSDAECQALTTL